jgi:OFA family oxalate/formate antiporter-like MFS transporter
MLLTGAILQIPFGLVFAWGAVVPSVRRDLGWSAALAGLVFSATPLGYGIGTLAGGRLAERLPPRRLCAAGTVLLVLGLAGSLALPGPVTFVALYGLLALGVGGGLALSGGVAGAVRLFPSRAGLVGGALTATYAAAAVVLAPMLAWLIGRLGWLAALRVVAAGLVLLALVALALMPGLGPPSVREGAEGRAAPPLLQLLARRRVWTGCLLVLLPPLLGSHAAVSLEAHAQAVPLAVWVGSTALILLACGNAAGRLAAGLGADRFGVDVIAFATLALDLLAMALLVASGSAAAVLLSGLAAGLTIGGAAGLTGRLGADGAPDAPSSAFGLSFAGYAAGALTGPLLGAAAGGGRASWLAVGLPALIGFPILWLRAKR